MNKDVICAMTCMVIVYIIAGIMTAFLYATKEYQQYYWIPVWFVIGWTVLIIIVGTFFLLGVYYNFLKEVRVHRR